MDKIKKDFHCHTNCSDGLFSPKELVEYAKANGIGQLSITDHDTISGQYEALEWSKENGITYMPGLELTSRYTGKNIHLLCYGFDIEKANSNKELAKYLEKTRQSDLKWVYEICEKSQKDPISLTLDGIEIEISITKEDFDRYPGTIFTYFHHAQLLSEKFGELSQELGGIPARHILYSFFGKMEEEVKYESYGPGYRELHRGTYEKYGLNTTPETFELEKDGMNLEETDINSLIKPYWWTKREGEHYLGIHEAIKLVKEIGGCPVVAHPIEQGLVEEDLRYLAGIGVEGIEVFTYKQDDECAEMLSKLCSELNILATGGSDFHDPYHRSKVSLGKYRSSREISGIDMQDFIDRGYKVYFPED